MLNPFFVAAHEEQNIQYPADENLWTFSKDIEHNEVFEWRFLAEAIGYEDREGTIRIEVLEHIYDLNLLDYLNTNDTDGVNDSLALYEEHIDQLFDVEFDDKITYFQEVYPVDYFIVPIIFKAGDNEVVNLFEHDFDRNTFFVSLVNDTIDNSCIQGCHSEDVTPFESVSSDHYYEENQLIIEGRFRVRDFPGSAAYNYDEGTFKAIYDTRGILHSWSWESVDGSDKLEIELKRFTDQELVILSIIGFIFLIVVGVAIKIYFRPRINV